jgi:hypothetical protein
MTHNEGHAPNVDEMGVVGVKKKLYTFHKRKQSSCDFKGDTPPSSLMDSIASLKRKTLEGKGVEMRSLARTTSRVEGCVRASGWD